MMSLNDTLRYLQQLQCNVKISLISTGDEVIGIGNVGLGCLPTFQQEKHFGFWLKWNKEVAFTSKSKNPLNSKWRTPGLKELLVFSKRHRYPLCNLKVES